MLVVSDTTPINYLVLMGVDRVLPELYGSVYVPAQVVEELRRDRAPKVVRDWASNLPSWVNVVESDPDRYPALDVGEAATLGLAVDLRAELLVDDAEARSAARKLGVTTIGTVGILIEAHFASLIDFVSCMSALQNTSFRIHKSVVEAATQAIKSEKSGG